MAGVRVAALVASLGLASCATLPYAPRPLATPGDLMGVQSKTVEDVTVTVAILTDEQSERHFGVDLAAHDLQALWARVRNASRQRLWVIGSVLERDFYSPDEAAFLMRSEVPKDAFEDLRQRLRDSALRARFEPATETEGFVILPRTEGGRYLEVLLTTDAYQAELEQASGAAAGPQERRFDFALPLPDGDFDYERLDPARVYAGRELPDIDLDRLRAELERLPCCATNANGTRDGDPLNVVIVGDAPEVLGALSRSGWSFTHRIDLRTIGREVGAAISGAAYPVAPVSSLYALGRKHDLALQRARRSIAQRNHMRLWLAPFTCQGRMVWIGQVSRDIGVKATPKSPTLTTHVIDPAVDTTREYLLHSLLAQGLVGSFGFVKGSAPATPSEARVNLTDDPYFSDGLRLVVVLAPEPVPLSAVRSLLWEQSAAPMTEGQSGAAAGNVRPLAPVEVASP
ncbi:MAG: LssY C-terminal domain-containing protein [Chromatiales bacterium]|nr:LssY C-terminal domain-containing protein [Chromatiales bacterium]